AGFDRHGQRGAAHDGRGRALTDRVPADGDQVVVVVDEIVEVLTDHLCRRVVDAADHGHHVLQAARAVRVPDGFEDEQPTVPVPVRVQPDLDRVVVAV